MNNLHQNFSRDLTDSDLKIGAYTTELSTRIDKPARISIGEMSKYVVGLVGIFMLCAISYPIAMNRVTQTKKFAPHQSYLKSLNLEYQSIEP